jgi:hypothetical protein
VVVRRRPKTGSGRRWSRLRYVRERVQRRAQPWFCWGGSIVTVLMAARLDVVLPRSPKDCEANHQVQAGYEGCEGGEGGAVCSSMEVIVESLSPRGRMCLLFLIPHPWAHGGADRCRRCRDSSTRRTALPRCRVAALSVSQPDISCKDSCLRII